MQLTSKNMAEPSISEFLLAKKHNRLAKTCIMNALTRHTRLHKLRKFRLERPFCLYIYSVSEGCRCVYYICIISYYMVVFWLTRGLDCVMILKMKIRINHVQLPQKTSQFVSVFNFSRRRNSYYSFSFL